MPIDSATAAANWHLENVQSRLSTRRMPRPGSVPLQPEVDAVARDRNHEHGFVFDGDDGTLRESIARLRHLERVTAEALERALCEGEPGPIVVLRRDHRACLASLHTVLRQQAKLDEDNAKVLSVARTFEVIDCAMLESVRYARTLPQLGHTPEERERLETFLRGWLETVKSGARDANTKVHALGYKGPGIKE